jgi:hypothetical protein
MYVYGELNASGVNFKTLHVRTMRLSLVLLLLLSVVSCAPVYLPNPPNSPLLSRPGEVVIEGGGTSLGGFYGNLAVASSNHFAALASGQYLKGEPTRSNGASSFFIEAGAGYYDTTKTSRVEVFALFGKGHSNPTGYETNLTSTSFLKAPEADYYRVAVQFDVGTNGDLFQLGVAGRASYVSFSNLQYDTTYYHSNSFSKSGNIIVAEPFFFFRIGGKNVMAKVQWGFIIPVSSNDSFSAFNSMLTLGLVLRLNALSGS